MSDDEWYGWDDAIKDMMLWLNLTREQAKQALINGIKNGTIEVKINRRKE